MGFLKFVTVIFLDEGFHMMLFSLLFCGIGIAFFIMCYVINRVVKRYKLHIDFKKHQKLKLYRHFVDFCKLNGYNYVTFCPLLGGPLVEGNLKEYGRGLFYEKEIKLHDFNVLVNKYGFESVTIPQDSIIHEYISIVYEPIYGGLYYDESYRESKYFYHFYSIKFKEGKKYQARRLEHYIKLSPSVYLTDDTIIDELFMEKHEDSLKRSIDIFKRFELPYWKAYSLVNIVIEDMYSGTPLSRGILSICLSGKAKEDYSEWDTSYLTEKFLEKYANKYKDIGDFFYHEIIIRELHSNEEITQSKIDVLTIRTKEKSLRYLEDRYLYLYYLEDGNSNLINEHAVSGVTIEVKYQKQHNITCTINVNYYISLLYKEGKWLVDNISLEEHTL